MSKKLTSVLVTGGAGFIGSHLAQELIGRGYAVTVLDDLSGGFKDNVPVQADFIKGSVTDVSLIAKLFRNKKFDYIFHLAAYAAEGLSHFIKRFNYTNNVIGSVNLINEAVKNDVKCFVFTSSIAVYGTSQLPMTEDLIPQPEDSYGIAKFAVELELKACYEMFGLNYIIFRPHNVYGEKQNIGDKYRNVMGIFINNIMMGNSIPIFGDGAQTRAFSYIGDVVPIIATSIEKNKCYNQIFNIGADQYYTINELADTVITAMGKKVKKKKLPARSEVKHAYSDHTKVHQYFGEQQYVPLEEGVKRMVIWAKKKGVQRSKVFKNIEIYKNLPSAWTR